MMSHLDFGFAGQLSTPGMLRSAVFGSLAMVFMLAHGCSCDEEPPPVEYDVYHWEEMGSLDGAGDGFAAVGSWLYAIREGQLLSSDGNFFVQDETTPDGLPAGWVNLLAVIPDNPQVMLAHVWGHGLYRSTDDGGTWLPVSGPPTSPLIATMFNPRYQVLPYQITHDATDATRLYMAAPGGLFVSDDTGDSWTALNVGSGEKINLLFTGVVARDGDVYAVSQAPAGLVPDEYADLVEGGVFASTDDGESWEDITGDLPAQSLTGVTLDHEGAVWISAMDGGVWKLEEDGWFRLYGPSDAMGISSHEGGISVGSASRGVWRLDQGEWTHIGEGAIVSLAEAHAIGADGQVYGLVLGDEEPDDETAGGSVYVALSMHTSLYHSYRGDTPDDDGFGLDLDVIANTLDWLDEYPDVHADWDIDNAFSLDGILAEYGQDQVNRITARVNSGQDGLRLMSWNNGVVVAQTEEEFRASIEWAQDSYLATFGEYDPGVQPQECMFTPDHVGWYRDLGIEWMTQFYSATPFTGFRLDADLAGASLYNPLTLKDGDDEMILVPAYHHGDVLDHGGMRAWAEQISDTIEGDSLLLIHMDADAVLSENFDLEMAALQELDYVQFTTIQDYLDDHPAVADITLEGDLADGTGDGFQSWAEKSFNHEIATGIARARANASRATLLGAGDETVDSLVEAALEPRLLALSTTHFGLAAPYLCDDRIEAARELVAQAELAAVDALDAAMALSPVNPGTIHVLNSRDSGGRALLEIPLEVPAGVYAGPEGLTIWMGANEQAVAVDVVDDSGDPVLLQATAVVFMDALSDRTLTWSYDAANPTAVSGAVLESDLDDVRLPDVPFTECGGVVTDGSALEFADVVVDDRAVRASRTIRYAVDLCDGFGDVDWSVETYDELDGYVVRVQANVGVADDPDLAESVALTPFSCSGDASKLHWRAFSGGTRTRDVRPGQQTWNPVAADGWISVTCDDNSKIQFSHRVEERTSLAFLPMRNDQGVATMAPLGTLWGTPPWHDARRTGGLGLGDLFTTITGSQMYPAAPDWSGETVRYTLLVGSSTSEAVMDLFAHPPLVRVGIYYPGE